MSDKYQVTKCKFGEVGGIAYTLIAIFIPDTYKILNGKLLN
jgi:hypothetical protein